MWKFNNGNGAIICDHCRHMLIYPAQDDQFTEAPYFKPSGEAFCNLNCVTAYREEVAATPIEEFSFLKCPPIPVRHPDEEDDDLTDEDIE